MDVCGWGGEVSVDTLGLLKPGALYSLNSHKRSD
jgi:hypothetical protein